MPIKGLSRRAAILGRIKIGGRERVNTKNGERILPVRYDHFKITTNEQGELGYIEDEPLTRKLYEDQFRMLKEDVTERIYINKMINGEPRPELVKTIQHLPDTIIDERNKKLRRILVTLPSDDPDKNLVTSLSVYDRNGCRCRGDNETAEWIDPQTGDITKVSCPCNMLNIRLNDYDEVDHRPPHQMAKRGMVPDERRNFHCKANGILKVKIEQARIIGGVHLFRTTSINSIRQLLDSMESIRVITGGTLAGYPLNLVVESKPLKPKHNKPAHTGWVVNLVFKANEDEFLRYVIEKKALIQQLRGQLHSEEIQNLPAPGLEPPLEQIDIAQEYYNSEVDTEGDTEGDREGEAAEHVMDAQYEEKAPPPSAPPPRKEAPPPQEEAPPPQEEAQETPPQQTTPPEKAPEKTPESPPEAKESAQQQPHLRVVKDSKTAEGAEQVDQQPPAPTNDSAAEAQRAEQVDPQNEKADQGPPYRFSSMSREEPEGADTNPASKHLRKEFFAAARKAGMTDKTIRTWIEKEWNVQSSAALRTWQVEAMIQSLP